MAVVFGVGELSVGACLQAMDRKHGRGEPSNRLQASSYIVRQSACAKAESADAGSTMLVHAVYFWLKPELSAEQRADFRRGVESLGEIKGVEKVYVGAPAGTERRPIIDTSYGVSLVVLCRNVAAHDAYQIDPIHLKFVERYKTFWSRVQIYDSE